MDKFLCPVCRKHEFEKAGDYEICPVCSWENDKVQAKDFDFEGGANELSVNQARVIYVRNYNRAVIENAVRKMMEE